MNSNAPMEILAPAGNMDALTAAVYSGANAVYLGLKRFSARRTAGNFDADELRQAVSFCHGRGVKVYVAINTTAHPAEVEGLCDALADVCAGYEVDTPFGDTELGAVRYSNVAASAVLEDVKKKTGLSCWFEGKVLHCGNPYSDNAQRPEIGISLERNAVSQDLQRTDNDFEVTVLAILKGGRKMEAKAGTKGAQSVNLNYNVKDEKVTVEALKEVAERYYEGLKKQQYRGGIELFGIPAARHGDVIDLTSDITPEMNGKYLVEAVEKTFSDNAAYRQKLDLGGRVE